MRKVVELTKGGIVGLLAVVGLLSIGYPVFASVPGTNQRVSLTSTGGQANGSAGNSIVSADGKNVVYDSYAKNTLPPGINEGVLARSLETSTNVLVSVSTNGVPANGDSNVEKVSANGRYVVFKSLATNLIDGTTLPVSGSNPQLYLRDMATSTTTLISQSSSGVIADGGTMIALGVSSDGRFIAFTTNSSTLHPDVTTKSYHLYMLDRSDASLTILDHKTDGSLGSTGTAPVGEMSCDGSMVVFQYGNNLISGQPSTGHVDIHLLDRRGGSNKLTNITQSANYSSSAPGISCNGDYISFSSIASNLDSSMTVTYIYNAWRPYVYDRVSDKIHFAAVTTAGAATNASICGTTGNSSIPCIRLSDGGLGVFAANDPTLTGASGKQIYIHNINNNLTQLVSRDISGNVSNGFSDSPTINASGSKVVYGSSATNLISGDTNGVADIFTSLTGE